MATPISKIDELIVQARKALDDATSKVEKLQQKKTEAEATVRLLEAELRGLERARDALDKPGSRQQKPRRLSPSWRSILEYIGSKGEAGASIDEVEAFVQSNGLDIKRGAIKSQLSNYKTHADILDSVGDAHYRLTVAGQQLVLESAEP